MKVVVLDGHTLNPGDLNWQPLEALGEVVLHDRTRPEEIIPRAQAAEIILTNKTLLDRAILQRLPSLRYSGVLAPGYNVVDVAAAREQGVPVTNVPSYGTRSVAQHVFALLLELTQRTGHHARIRAQGEMDRLHRFLLPGSSPHRTGRAYPGGGWASAGSVKPPPPSRRPSACRVVATTRQGGADQAPGARGMDLEALLAESDVISLHCPLTSATTGLINAPRRARVKPSAYLINTSPGARQRGRLGRRPQPR